MIKFLITSFLILMSVCYVFAEESTVFSNPEFGLIQETAQNDKLEKLRIIVKNYEEGSAEEKTSFLSELEQTEEQFKRLRDWTQLDWKTDGSYSFPQSHSTISIPRGYYLLTGKDAETACVLDGNPPPEKLEAYFVTSDLEGTIVLQYFETGYISTEDWENIDSKELLNEIIQNTEEDNKERRKMGHPELNIIGWVQEPTLDHETNTVYWAVEANSGDDENNVNSKAIRLGREGYLEINSITSPSLYVPFGGHLETMLRSHRFDLGYSYNDYKTGDHRAEYGIVALIAGTLGGKVIKSVGFMVLLKKFGSLLFTGIAAMLYNYRSLFRRKKD